MWLPDVRLEIVLIDKLEIFGGGTPGTGKPAAASFTPPHDANRFQRRYWII